ncbi:hypothetical protein MMC09_005892 [Bachmanniomyces sp. S44760]|nr:hypothetical protein [Bachmanniomyces sp. S44760]
MALIEEDANERSEQRDEDGMVEKECLLQGAPPRRKKGQPPQDQDLVESKPQNKSTMSFLQIIVNDLSPYPG